ncbi:glycosyltransferase [Rheinheimera sp.]|uniref:glycosyltransferase n=1 Tax=Rheinheimera sp. TaxID=1869214 RepID=UPI003AF923FE
MGIGTKRTAALRVLHVGKFFPPFLGGIENFMADLLNAQNSAGVKADALVHQHVYSWRSDVEEHNQSLIYRAACLGRLVFAPVSPWFLFDYQRCAAQTKPELLHLHMPNTSVFWLLLSPKARQLPWVVHWHSDVLGDKAPWYLRLLYPLYRPFEKAVLAKAAAVICTSEAYAQSSQVLAQVRHKLEIVPLGLPDVPFQTAESRSPGPLRLLMIGRLTYYKGHQVLLNALSALPRDSVQLTLVGEGELADVIHNQIRQLQLPNVHMAGRVSGDDINQLLDQCDLLVLPSIEKTEAFGLVLLEAARRAKPALVTSVKGSAMSWVVQHNQTGWVVAPGSETELKQQIERLMAMPELCKAYGQAARQRFQNCFVIEAVAGKINDLYARMLKSS